MDTKNKLRQWAKKMGYDRELPSGFESVCNTSTFFVWEEIMRKVKPKQEVEVARKNIIMNRLKTKSLKDQDEFSFPMPEVDNFRQKKDIDQQIQLLKDNICEKETLMDKISLENNVKYVLAERLKQTIKEDKERTFLLNCKCHSLEGQISHAEDLLGYVKNLTPAEMDENPNTSQITETLEKCSKKLEKLIAEIPEQDNLLAQDETAYVSVLKSVKKSARKPLFSAKKQNNSSSKTNLFCTASSRKANPSKVAKSLHLGDIKEKNESGRSILQVQTNNISTLETSQLSQKIMSARKTVEKEGNDNNENKENKRESLGILPDAFLTEAMDEFLEVDVFQTQESTSVASILSPKTSMSSEIRYDATFSAKTQAIQTDIFKVSPFEEIQKHEAVMEIVKNLLHSNNRVLIWKCVELLCNNLLSETRNMVMHFDTLSNSKNKRIDETDIARLHFTHIKTELDILRCKIVNSDLEQKVEKAKRNVLLQKTVFPSGLLREKQSDIQQIIELQIQDCKLDAALSYLKKELNSSRTMETSNQLHLTNNKLTHVKQDMFSKLNLIERYTQEIFKIVDSVSYTCSGTACSVRKLNNFISDLHWALMLKDNLNSQEILIFSKFPIEYNRKFTFTEPSTYYRNICTSTFGSDIQMDSNTLQMITMLLGSPFSPPETLVVNLVKSKLKLAIMKSLQNLPADVVMSEYTPEDLKKQESYIHCALDKLNGILNSSSNAKVLSSANVMKEVMNLWIEMPFKDFISPNRLLEDKSYVFFENNFNNFFDNL